MSLLTILLVVIIAGVLCYVIKQLPIDPPWKGIAYAVVVIFFIVWLIRALRAANVDLTI
jgi:hypothetical protein